MSEFMEAYVHSFAIILPVLAVGIMMVGAANAKLSMPKVTLVVVLAGTVFGLWYAAAMELSQEGMFRVPASLQEAPLVLAFLFGGMLLGFTKQEVEQRLEAIKEFSGLGDSFELPVKSYSSGMASRLKFAVAINLEPDVMLLDELLAVGDVGFRKQAAAVMQEKIVSEQTTVLVSHNAGDIRRLCDRAILLEHGEIIADGNPEVVLQEYQKVQNVLL